MERIILGSHVKMAGKEMFLSSVKEAESYGANALMIYTGAPQNTKRKELDQLNIDAGLDYAKKVDIKNIIIHAPYIINLANTVKAETFKLGIEIFSKEIDRTAAFKSQILVLHPGSHLEQGIEAGIEQLAKGLNQVLDQDENNVYIALETMAGKGASCIIQT